MGKISVVINTRNEEENLPRALSSIKNLADEIVVVDMFSSDKTVAIAKKAGAIVFTHPTTGYVEPARNFAIGKTKRDWILILDADEEVPPKLAKILKKIASGNKVPNFYRIPRKNIIFGKWINHSRWWPDYNIRFFKKGSVRWSEIIHSVPETHGVGIDLPAKESNALVHRNYQSVGQYLERMGRYADIQANTLVRNGYKFSWQDLIRKPLSEFVSRFFAGEGYKDGVHGFVLATLQAFSEFIIFVKVWETEKFKEIELSPTDINKEITNIEKELEYWAAQKKMRKVNPLSRMLRRLGK